MLDFNLEYYRAFYFVAQLGSVTKAAEALFLTQPAVTHSIQMLEAHFGQKLFTRTPKGMRLTFEGEQLFSHVSTAFDAFMAGEKTLQRLANFESGKLEIAATETALYYFLLPQIESFKKLYPKIFINVTGSSTPETLQMLQSGKADLALAVSPVHTTEGLTVKPLQQFHDIFIAGPHFAALKGRELAANEITRYPLVTVERGTSARSHIDLWFGEKGVLFEPDYSVRTSTTVLPFVERNIAVGIIPSMFAQDYIEQGRIFQVIMQEPIPPRKTLLIYKDEVQMPQICRRFVDFICEASMVQA